MGMWPSCAESYSAIQPRWAMMLRQVAAIHLCIMRPGEGTLGPLSCCCRKHHHPATSGANPNAATRGMGATPLHRAAMQGHLFVVERLLAAGADARAADCDLETPLHKAAVQGHGEVCRLLLERCPEAGEAADKAGRTPGQRATGAAVKVFQSWHGADSGGSGMKESAAGGEAG
ncbi:hypothetical protein VaNZ11_006433 [Volvox africanus]|uniref:Uncharacterized protein n=1 Tax=Volvox africanus TaxID=51714 RepID=A0ABQ5S0R3_9CHLO|nr:hypothetical protein VaNZ11_006433 [Volvox africanus]